MPIIVSRRKLRLMVTLLVTLISVPAAADSVVVFPVCFDFGCRNQLEVSLGAEEWQTVVGIFDAANAIDERKQIKVAVARMEQLAGKYSPIHRDLARNLPLQDSAGDSAHFPGQLDCIDESINTTRFIQMFSDHGLLHFHRVLDRAYRRSFITQHWAAHIQDHQSGKRYVIDSWFDPNGMPPVLVSSERWHDLSL